MADHYLHEEQPISNNFKVHLNEWKKLLILLSEIMVRNIFWFTVITVMCITSLYLYIWLVNCSTFNIIWTVCLCASLLDCFVCGPLIKILPASSWDENKEHVYADIFFLTSHYYAMFKIYIVRFFFLRQSNRMLFHSVLIALFCTLLYIGKTCNNLLVSYIAALVICLVPIFNTRHYLQHNNKKMVW